MTVNFMLMLDWVTSHPDPCDGGWVGLCGCFWMRFEFELVDWVKQTALPSRSGLPPIHEGLGGTKRLSESICALCLKLGHQALPDSDTHSGWDVNRQLSWVSSLPTADLRTSQPPLLREPIPHHNSHCAEIYKSWKNTGAYLFTAKLFLLALIFLS